MNHPAVKVLLTVLGVLMLSAAADAAEINLSVAASLREVINDLSATFARKNSGVTFIKNYGASGSLAKQLENGAPADIYISANLDWMEHLKQKKLLDNQSITTFAYNELVFVGKSGVKAESLTDLVRLDRIAIGSPKSVPAGEYAMEAIRKAGIDKQLEKKLVMAKDVREGLLYAERGEVDGSFVYRTDALQSGKNLKILFTVPRNFYSRVTYPMALTTQGSGNTHAAAFFRFLHSAEAGSTLVKYGFPPK